MNGTRTFPRMIFVLISFGFIGLFAMLGRPTMADIRAVDMVHLIATGMCFGGAIVALAWHLHGRQSK